MKRPDGLHDTCEECGVSMAPDECPLCVVCEMQAILEERIEPERSDRPVQMGVRP